MGELMRRYWIPAALSVDVVADARPTAIRLLGEDLIVFRDSDGTAAITSVRCPHRGAPLIYGRNEDCGLRCVYHGWKFDTSGACVDMPTEPPGTKLKDSVRLLAYDCRERNGVIWVYMGPGRAPELPELEWNLVPDDNVFLSLRVQECNWLQALEGELDSSHAPILHSRLDSRLKDSAWYADLAPRFELLDTDYGAMVAARRQGKDNRAYWRINQFLVPFYTLVPPSPPVATLSGHAWVPIDDETTLCFMFTYHPTEPLSQRTREMFRDGFHGRETGHLSIQGRDTTVGANVPYARYRPQLTELNDFGFSDELQRTTYFSGLPGLWVQDAACQSGVEPILDRTQEHLGSSDAGILRARRILRAAAEGLRDEGRVPVGAVEPSAFHVRAAALLLDDDESWPEAAAKHVYGRGELHYEAP